MSHYRYLGLPWLIGESRVIGDLHNPIGKSIIIYPPTRIHFNQSRGGRYSKKSTRLFGNFRTPSPGFMSFFSFESVFTIMLNHVAVDITRHTKIWPFRNTIWFFLWSVSCQLVLSYFLMQYHEIRSFFSNSGTNAKLRNWGSDRDLPIFVGYSLHIFSALDGFWKVFRPEVVKGEKFFLMIGCWKSRHPAAFLRIQMDPNGSKWIQMELSYSCPDIKYVDLVHHAFPYPSFPKTGHYMGPKGTFLKDGPLIESQKCLTWTRKPIHGWVKELCDTIS